jgi:predicted dehydrogenase
MKLRGAISGFGEVAARAHLTGWRMRDDVSLMAIHDPVAARRHEAIRLIKNVRVYDDLELMLDGEAPEFVDVASPPAYHAAAVRAALKAHAHVLVEKPLCLSLDEFDELAALAGGGGRILMCVHNWKHAPAYRAARDAITAGKIGRVRRIALDRMRTQPAGAGGAGGRWRMSAETGGGILIDHGWHVFYLMRWLMGAEPRAVSARFDTPAGGGAEDVADVRLDFGDGRFGEAHLSWRSPARRTSAVIAGDAGTVEVDEDVVRIVDGAGRVDERRVTDKADDSYHGAWFAGVAEAFVEAITRGPSSHAAQENIAEARDALAVIAAARRSAARGGVESIVQRL